MASFPFPHVTTTPPTIPPPPVPMSYRGNNNSNTPSQHSQGSNVHQYQVPSAAGPMPIYAVSNVLHNNANPKVKNISQLSNGNWTDKNGHQLPLQLQIPNGPPSQTPVLNNNNRSGSQASSGYQSQSPVEDKTKKAAVNANIGIQSVHQQQSSRTPVAYGASENGALTFNNPVFHRKSVSHSVDNLTSVGLDFNKEPVIIKRRYG